MIKNCFKEKEKYQSPTSLPTLSNPIFPNQHLDLDIFDSRSSLVTSGVAQPFTKISGFSWFDEVIFTRSL